MTTYIVLHKHCGMTMTITGETLANALRTNGLRRNLWVVIDQYAD